LTWKNLEDGSKKLQEERLKNSRKQLSNQSFTLLSEKRRNSKNVKWVISQDQEVHRKQIPIKTNCHLEREVDPDQNQKKDHLKTGMDLCMIFRAYLMRIVTQ
jgi:hypothetical protein